MRGVDAERFWDERARENAMYFVDNRLEYASPDADAFWRRGDEIVDAMFALAGLAPSPEDEVLDIGCGLGRLSRALAARVRRVYALDVSGEMLALARRHNADLRNVEWLHGDGSSLAVLDDACVDGCFSHVVFQHVPDPAITCGYVREMGRVLRPGGWALFQVSTDPAVHRGGSDLRARVKALLRAQPADRDWWGSAVEVAALRGAAADGGLDVERILDEGSQFTTVFARRRP